MNIVTEIKNTLEGINSRLDEVQDQINDLEDKVAVNIQSKQQKREKIINEDSVRKFWDNIKHNTICIIGILEVEEIEQGTENLF